MNLAQIDALTAVYVQGAFDVGRRFFMHRDYQLPFSRGKIETETAIITQDADGILALDGHDRMNYVNGQDLSTDITRFHRAIGMRGNNDSRNAKQRGNTVSHQVHYW